MTHEARRFINQFRQNIAKRWDVDTAYAKDRPQAGPGKSNGQCVVTSLILQQELKEKFGTETELMLGQVQDTDGGVLIQGHGWLRYNDEFIDVTVDQAEGVDLPVFVGTPDEAQANDIVYIYDEPIDRDEILKNQETLIRYQTLNERYLHW